MTKLYCFDTSGLSNPYADKPEDIYGVLWVRIIEVIESGAIAVNEEIYEEMCRIQGILGAAITSNKGNLIMDLSDNTWNPGGYLACVNGITQRHRQFIREYNGGSPKTIGINDVSIVALAQFMNLPLVSMETEITTLNSQKRKIPNICRAEQVEHLTFNEFLRREGIRFV